MARMPMLTVNLSGGRIRRTRSPIVDFGQAIMGMWREDAPRSPCARLDDGIGSPAAKGPSQKCTGYLWSIARGAVPAHCAAWMTKRSGRPSIATGLRPTPATSRWSTRSTGMMPCSSIPSRASASIRGRRGNSAHRAPAQPNKKHFTAGGASSAPAIPGSTEFVLTYDGQPSYTVSIMEFKDGKVARETQYFGDAFGAGTFARSMGREKCVEERLKLQARPHSGGTMTVMAHNALPYAKLPLAHGSGAMLRARVRHARSGARRDQAGDQNSSPKSAFAMLSDCSERYRNEEGRR